MWNSGCGKENRFQSRLNVESSNFVVCEAGAEGASLQNRRISTWTQSPVKVEPFQLKQQHVSVESLPFCDAERELDTDVKESDVPPKTPSKQEVGDIPGKSPLKSAGKRAQAWQFLLSSVGRLSPKLSPVDKKPNLFSSSKKLFASPLKGTLYPQNGNNIAPLESTPNLEDLDHVKRTRRTLFTPEVAASFDVYPEKREKESGFRDYEKNGNIVNQKASSKLSRIREKTNSLFRVASAVHSPQKNKKLEGRKFDKLVEQNISFRENKTGQPSVNMLYEFSARDMEPFFLKYLDDSDLFCCSLVCKQWNSLLKEEFNSRKQVLETERRSFLSLNSTQEDFENFSPYFPHSHTSKFNSGYSQVSTSCSFSASNPSPFHNFSPLIAANDRTSSNLVSSQQMPSSDFAEKRELKLSKSQYLVPEINNKNPNSEFSVLRNKVCQSTSLVDVRTSREDKLVKCPSCMSRAKVTPMKEEGVCFNEMCQYRFCSRCDSPYHGSSRCVSGLGCVSIEEITSPTKLQAMVTEMNCSGNSERENSANVSTEKNNLCLSKPKLQSSNSSLCSKRSRNSLRRL